MNTQDIADHLKLRALVDQVSIFADKKDFEAQVQLFTEDAITEINVGGNLIMQLTGREAMSAAFEGFNKSFATSFHLNGQHVVAVKGDHANGTLYSHITLLSVEHGKKVKSTIGAVYQDGYERINARWLIASRRGTFIWQDKNLLDP